MSSNTEKIRREILEILYANVSESLFDTSSVDRDRLYRGLSYPKREIDKNINNLEARRLIKFHYSLFADDWSSASLTDEGIEYYESIEIVDNEYSPASNVAHQTFNVQGNFIGSASQTQRGDILNINNITSAFDQAKKIVENEEEFDDYDKKKTIEKLEALEEEAKAEKPDESRVQILWGWIQKYAPSGVVAVLAKIAAEVIIRSMLPV